MATLKKDFVSGRELTADYTGVNNGNIKFKSVQNDGVDEMVSVSVNLSGTSTSHNIDVWQKGLREEFTSRDDAFKMLNTAADYEIIAVLK